MIHIYAEYRLNKDERRFLYKNMNLSLYFKGSKRVTQGLRVRGSWRPNITAIYWPPLLWPSALSFSFSRAVQPEAQRLSFLLSAGFLYHILSITPATTPTQSGAPSPFGLMWLSLTYLLYNSVPSTTVWLLSWLSYIIVPRPLNRLLDLSNGMYVWSSSSGNNCHAVHRTLSFGASVYECTMGILACPILLAKSTYVISPHKCHRNVSLPSDASLCNGKFGRVEGQNTTISTFVGYLMPKLFS